MRVCEHHGSENVTLLTADTSSEAEDWYEFVPAAAEYLGADLVVLKDGRDIWDVAWEKEFMPSPITYACSRTLKVEPLNRWVREHCGADTVEYFGFDWTEDRRINSLVKRRPRANLDFPLLWNPIWDKAHCVQLVKDTPEVPTPRAYELGLPHNNCLKYGCVRSGIASWKQFQYLMPEAFERAVAEEAALTRHLQAKRGEEHTLRRITVNGKQIPMPLGALAKMTSYDKDDWGACGCYVE